MTFECHIGCVCLQEGGFPIKMNPDGSVRIPSAPRESRVFDNRVYIMEEAIKGDFAMVKAHKADTRGNLIFHGTAMNFNPEVAKAGKITIAEVEEIVEPGELDPAEIHVSGIYVDRYVWPGKQGRLCEEGVGCKRMNGCHMDGCRMLASSFFTGQQLTSCMVYL